jgi:ABC-type dipeptide/oligopeptide/nickel transport system ATPase subunit
LSAWRAAGLRAHRNRRGDLRDQTRRQRQALIKGKPQTCDRRIRPPVWGSASARKIGKRTALLPPPRCGKISFWRCRRSAAGCGRSRKEQNAIAERFIRQLGIRTPSAEQPIEFLSGGNQQKVLLSRWLLTKPQFLILDEPTRGIDVGAHAEIIRLIETLCADGLALLVISSELEELVGYADRVIIMRDRKQVAEIPLAELSVPAIMNAIAA